EVVAGEADAVMRQMLFDSGVDGPALLRPQARIAGMARVSAKRLVEPRLLDALAVAEAKPRCSPQVASVAHSECRSGAWHSPGAEAGVVFHAEARVDHQTRGQLPPPVQEAGLIVASRVAA